MQIVQTIIAYLLIVIGIGMEVVTVLVWLGVLHPTGGARALQSFSVWDLLLELLKRAPWPATVGLLMIYAGLKLLGVQLPF